MTAPLPNPEDEEQFTERLEREFTRPEATFQSQSLYPLSKSSLSLLRKVSDDNDSSNDRALFYIFIHKSWGEKSREDDLAKHILPLVWGDINAFRAKCLTFRDMLTDEEMDQIVRIAANELDLLRLTEFIATPPQEGPAKSQKKSPAQTSRRSRGKSPRQRKR